MRALEKVFAKFVFQIASGNFEISSSNPFRGRARGKNALKLIAVLLVAGSLAPWKGRERRRGGGVINFSAQIQNDPLYWPKPGLVLPRPGPRAVESLVSLLFLDLDLSPVHEIYL